jgi:hypothetical protein
VIAVSLQALSVPVYPGVATMDIIDNVVPYIKVKKKKLNLNL